MTRITGNSSATYNILYRTTDSQYKPTWAVTTLFVPKLGANSTAATLFNQSALLSYQIIYDSADLNASPSFALQKGDYDPSPVPDIANAFYAHPVGWNEIGWGGPASPRGYVRMQYDMRDPWEPVESTGDNRLAAERSNRNVR